MLRATFLSMSILLASHLTPVQGQVVQLPSFQVFGVNTTVLVPDRGSVMLGGVNRSTQGSVSRGVPGLSKLPGANRLFSNRAIGSETSSSTLHVSVFVHDLAAMDEALLAEAAAQRDTLNLTKGPQLSDHDRRKVGFLNRSLTKESKEHIPASTASADVPLSVAEIRRQNAAALAAQNEEASELFEKAQEYEQAGNFGSARIYYQRAARRATNELKTEALARWTALQPTRHSQ